MKESSLPKTAVADMDYYVVFDPDDESGLVYRWYGGQTVGIYDADSNEEVDVYTIGDIDQPTLEQVQDSVSEHHESVLQEMAKDGNAGNDQDDPNDAKINMDQFEQKMKASRKAQG